MNAYRFRNFINKDPILDYFSVSKGFVPDNKLQGFDERLLLENYTRKNKKIFIEKILEEIGEESIIRVSKDCFLLKTKSLKDHFKNYHRFKGENYSLFTVEYSTITTLKNDVISSTHRFYNFKNWLFKNETNIIIDYSFVLGRRYSKHKSFDFLAEMVYDFKETLLQATNHLETISTKTLGVDLIPNLKNTSDYPWHNAKKLLMTTQDQPIDRVPFVNYNKLPLPEGNLIFLDFEILTSVWDDFSSFPKSNDKSILFNIGCVFNKKQITWVVSDLKDEKDTFLYFVNFLKSIESPVLIHWTNIEKRIFEEKCKEYNVTCNHIRWFDFHEYFVKSQVKVSTLNNLKLKNVSRVFKQSGLIQSDWSKGLIFDGIGAMTGYITYLETGDKTILDKIQEYNMVDCLVMMEIFKVVKDDLFSKTNVYNNETYC